MIGTKELLILAGIIVLLFGAKKIPALAKSIGQSVGYLKKGLREGEEGIDKENKK